MPTHFLPLHILLFTPLLASASLIPSPTKHTSALRRFNNNSVSTRDGLSFESCLTNRNCRGDHSCIVSPSAVNEVVLCENDRSFDCVCSPIQSEECQPPSDCIVQCANTADCRGEAECLRLGSRNICTATCSNDDNCIQGEVCFHEDGFPSPICIEEDFANGLEGERVGVCIDAEALKHLAREDVVYENDVRAKVLCDASGSCATPGHMVRFQGKAMMMKSYCELVGCVRGVKHVNSPRWSRGLTVSSKTEGLDYTAFAARYETKLEERALEFMVRMRL